MKEETELNLKLWARGRSVPLLPDEISVLKDCRVYISEELMKRIMEHSVELYYDENAKVIALKPQKDSSDAYVIRKEKKSRNFSFTPRKLLQHLKVQPKRYKAKWNPKLQMLIFHYEEKTEPNSNI
jgi:predicted transcriptional regulator